MNTLSYKTVSANKLTVRKEWVVFDATNQALGRFSSKVAKVLRGKTKTNYTPHVDCGDNVIVINAEKIRMSGKKWTDRELFHYTGYIGGQVIETPLQILAKDPTRLVKHAVRGMLPKTKLGDAIIKNLYVYVGGSHKHEAQAPKVVDINSIK
jgi:large subunit ribosomal protein L13